ncbi:MAG: hypothetical protein J2P50_09680 [Hyphomicrobiaceae bacterium]|nr:hypothetical protein [Hyphomicrobiaceae bacterium]
MSAFIQRPHGEIYIFLTPQETANVLRRLPPPLTIYGYEPHERQGVKGDRGQPLYDWSLDELTPSDWTKRVEEGDQNLYAGRCADRQAFKLTVAWGVLSTHGVIKIRAAAFRPEAKELLMATIDYGETEAQALARGVSPASCKACKTQW